MDYVFLWSEVTQVSTWVSDARQFIIQTSFQLKTTSAGVSGRVEYLLSAAARDADDKPLAALPPRQLEAE